MFCRAALITSFQPERAVDGGLAKYEKKRLLLIGNFENTWATLRAEIGEKIH
jgi:hypothetical protein